MLQESVKVFKQARVFWAGSKIQEYTERLLGHFGSRQNKNTLIKVCPATLSCFSEEGDTQKNLESPNLTRMKNGSMTHFILLGE